MDSTHLLLNQIIHVRTNTHENHSMKPCYWKFIAFIGNAYKEAMHMQWTHRKKVIICNNLCNIFTTIVITYLYLKIKKGVLVPYWWNQGDRVQGGGGTCIVICYYVPDRFLMMSYISSLTFVTYKKQIFTQMCYNFSYSLG